MANAATAAGNNGVSGATSTTTAIRNSVSQTEGGSFSRSDVKSETKILRFAYNTATGPECDTPTISR